MAAIANGVDFLIANGVDFLQLGEIKEKESLVSTTYSGMKSMLVAAYMVAFMFLVGMHDFASVPGLSEFSFVYFMASALQLLAFLSVLMKIKGTKSVAGISSGSLTLSACGLFARTLSTAFYDGYLPADNSADFAIQMVDGTTLLVVIYILYSVHKTYVHTYQDQYDKMPIKPLLCACLVCAAFIHADLNRCYWWDTLWSFSLNVEVFQMLPQLYMLASVGGAVEKCTSHFVVNMFLACICRIGFWLWAIPGCEDLSSPDGIQFDMRLGGYYILIAYFIEFCVHLDFMYYWVKACWRGDAQVCLPTMASDEI